MPTKAKRSTTCRMGLEGIVSKRRDSPYRSGRQETWIEAQDVSERVVGQFEIRRPLTGARDLRDSGAYCDYGQISCKDRV